MNIGERLDAIATILRWSVEIYKRGLMPTNVQRAFEVLYGDADDDDEPDDDGGEGKELPLAAE